MKLNDLEIEQLIQELFQCKGGGRQIDDFARGGELVVYLSNGIIALRVKGKSKKHCLYLL